MGGGGRCGCEEVGVGMGRWMWVAEGGVGVEVGVGVGRWKSVGERSGCDKRGCNK